MLLEHCVASVTITLRVSTPTKHAEKTINVLTLLGRALCCVKGEQGSPGSNNFDLYDNVIDLNAGKAVLDSLRNGVVGRLGNQEMTESQ